MSFFHGALFRRETERTLRGTYVSGFQPSRPMVDGDLGLRPRLVWNALSALLERRPAIGLACRQRTRAQSQFCVHLQASSGEDWALSHR